MYHPYRPPLTLYVIWHPDYADGPLLADGIFRHFGRDTSRPLARGMGIPVFFRSQLAADGQLPPLQLEEASHSVVIPLIDSHFVVDDRYREALGTLAHTLMEPQQPHRLISIGLSPGAFNIPQAKRLNMVRLDPWVAPEAPSATIDEKKSTWAGDALRTIIREISVELCRILLHTGQDWATHSTGIYDRPASLQLFLSYARRDGREAVRELLLQTASTPSLNVFWDETSIAKGYDFGAEIKAAIEKSMLVVFLTDVYATREWCLKEVLYAKWRQRPILVVDALEGGEPRSFPYIGNVPTMRWKGDQQAVIDKAITVALDFFYQKRVLNQSAAYWEQQGLLDGAPISLARAPEMLDIAEPALLKLKSGTILYPDPPLSDEESALVTRLNENIRLVTPNYLPSMAVQGGQSLQLTDQLVAISISESDADDMARRGLGKAHHHDYLSEFVRYFFAGGAEVLYGGSLQQEGFTRTLIDLAREYRRDNAKPCFHNILAWPHSRAVSVDLRAELFGVADFHAYVADPDMGVNHQLEVADFTVREKLAAVASNTTLRIELSKYESLRVLMGGKLRGYSGFMPGLLEEAYYTLWKGNPLYLLGALGGCTGAICDVLLGKNPVELTEAYCKALDGKQALHDAWEAFPNPPESLRNVPRNPDTLVKFIREKGIAGLNNGLDEDENRRLFTTPHVPEMVGLVLKGLAKVLRRD